jgi:hypothetical protein
VGFYLLAAGSQPARECLSSDSQRGLHTAQAATRHSSSGLTMDGYTDPSLLDVAGAPEALPELSVETPG